MKRKLPKALTLILTASLLVGGGCRDKTAAGAETKVPAIPPVTGDLVVTARLEEIPGPFPANDIYSYAFVMKYRIIQVLQGDYPDRDILVGHYNPRLAREDIHDDFDAKVGGNAKSFQVGDFHYLVLTPLDPVWTGALEDDYFKDKRERQWALWTDRIADPANASPGDPALPEPRPD